MLTTLLFVTAFALPPTDNLVHLDLQLQGWAGYQGYSYRGATTQPTGLVEPSSRNVYGGGEVDATFYLHPLHDDDAPAPYQSFLQRAAEVSLSVGGSGASGFFLGPPSDAPQVEVERRHWSFANAAIRGYPVRWLHLAAGLALRDDYTAFNFDATETLKLTPWAETGIRFDDVLLTVGYEVPTTQTHTQNETDKSTVDFHVPFAGNVYFNGDFVIARRSELSVSLTLVPHGAQASGSVSVYFGRRFAFDLGVSGGSTRQNDAPDAVTNAGAFVGLTWWVMSRAGAHIEYNATWWGEPQGETVQEHVVYIALRMRPY